MPITNPVQRGDGIIIGKYYSDKNIFVRKLNYKSHIFRKTNSSTFDENVIKHLEAYVDYYDNALEELVMVNEYKDKPYNHSITYKEFLKCTDNKENLIFHHGKNIGKYKPRYKQYEIPIENMVKETNGKT
jgi:hypothetical protein